MSTNPYSAPTSPMRQAPPSQSLGNTLFSFEGRIPRRVFWGVSLVIGLVYVLAVFIAASVFGNDSGIGLVVMMVLYIPIIWISLAIQAKRWHDRDKSGWWWLINFVPFIGGIWAFVECGCLRGTVGPNQFGLDPT